MVRRGGHGRDDGSGRAGRADRAAAIVTLTLARQALEQDGGDARALVSHVLEQAEQATTELGELAHGILPSALTRGGLRAGVQALVARMPVAVETDVSLGRLPAAVEASAYLVIAEALTNVTKHACAASVTVTARVQDRLLQIDVRDDGVGGARSGGSGLLGLADRIAVLEAGATSTAPSTAERSSPPPSPTRLGRRPGRGAEALDHRKSERPRSGRQVSDREG